MLISLRKLLTATFSFKPLKHASILLIFLLSNITTQPSSAVELSVDGHGDAAIFPYFSAKRSWQTFVRIANDSEYATATKIRFKEAANGRTISDFILFLAPYDQWNAWTGANAADGSPGIRTKDTSCIFAVTPNPSAVTANFSSLSSTSTLIGAKFSDAGFTGSYDDGGNISNTINDRLSEGHIEVIGIAKFSALSNNPSVIRFINHITNNSSTGKPNNCSSAKTEFTGNLRGSERDLGAGPEFDHDNTMIANAYLINVGTGQGASYNPRMLINFSNTSFIDESVSSETKPDLDSAITPNIWRDHTRTSQHGILGRSLLTGGVDAVSAALARKSLSNEWALKKATDPNSVFKNSFSQWIINFPTKQYYVDLQFDSNVADDISPALADHSGNDDAWSPFTTQFPGTGSSCIEYSMHIRNDEGGAQTHNETSGLCYQTNVLSFGSEFSTKGLASAFSTIVPESSLPLDATNTAPAKLGIAQIDFTKVPTSFTDDNGTTYHGLPVDGFMLYNYESNNRNSNYTTAQSHSYFRKTTVLP